MTGQEQLIPFSPGERLQSARRELGYARSDVAARLKCSEQVIRAFEEGGEAGLAPVYLHGFLKAYVQLLGITGPEAARLIEHWQERPPDLHSVFPEAPSNQPADRWLRAASYVLASLLVGTLAWQVSHEVVRLSQGDREAQLVITPGAEPETVADNGEPVNASIAALESLVEDRGPAAGSEAWAALERARAPDLQEGEYLLGLKASADSWVEIRDAQDELLEQDLLRAGTAREYRGFGPFRITLGRTSAIEFSVGGQIIDLAPFATDDVTQMLLDPDSLLADSGQQ